MAKSSTGRWQGVFARNDTLGCLLTYWGFAKRFLHDPVEGANKQAYVATITAANRFWNSPSTPWPKMQYDRAYQMRRLFHPPPRNGAEEKRHGRFRLPISGRLDGYLPARNFPPAVRTALLEHKRLCYRLTRNRSQQFFKSDEVDRIAGPCKAVRNRKSPVHSHAIVQSLLFIGRGGKEKESVS